MGAATILVGFFLYQVFQDSPDARFPSGRFPAYCLCYLLVLIGTGFVYSGAVQNRRMGGTDSSMGIIVAGGLSLWTAILGFLLFGPRNASTRIVIAGIGFKTNDTIGRLLMLPFVLIFGVFSLLAWWSVIQQIFCRKKPNPSPSLQTKTPRP